jgi:hypothetical protein
MQTQQYRNLYKSLIDSENMEESLYHKIREDTMNDKSIHNKFVKLIEAAREKELEDSRFPVKLGIPTPSFMYKKHLKTLEKIRDLNECNKFYEEYLNKNKSYLMRRVLQN